MRPGRVMGVAYMDEMMGEAIALLRHFMGAERKIFHVGATRFACIMENGTDRQTAMAQLQGMLDDHAHHGSTRFVTTATFGLAPFTVGSTSAVDLLRRCHGAAPRCARHQGPRRPVQPASRCHLPAPLFAAQRLRRRPRRRRPAAPGVPPAHRPAQRRVPGRRSAAALDPSGAGRDLARRIRPGDRKDRADARHHRLGARAGIAPAGAMAGGRTRRLPVLERLAGQPGRSGLRRPRDRRHRAPPGTPGQPRTGSDGNGLHGTARLRRCRALQAIAAAGVRLAIDDFETGQTACPTCRICRPTWSRSTSPSSARSPPTPAPGCWWGR